MADKIDISKLESLPADARARVEDALKKSLDKELATSAAGKVGKGAGDVMAHSRSKGAFFSRSKTSDNIRDLNEHEMVKDVARMDDASFNKFAERLATLKGIGGKPK